MTPARTAPGFLSSAAFRRFTLDEYHRMIAGGVLTDGEPVELLDGYLVRKVARGTPHDSALDELEGLLGPLLPAGWFLRGQRAGTLPPSEPEPDLAVVRGPRSRYRAAHPTAADIGLLVEVSDSSLAIDRTDKLVIFAAAGVPVYWVVNIPDRRVEVYARPTAGGYADATHFAVGQDVPVALEGRPLGAVPVARLFS
jgi:Uma2 family endonuclease